MHVDWLRTPPTWRGIPILVKGDLWFMNVTVEITVGFARIAGLPMGRVTRLVCIPKILSKPILYGGNYSLFDNKHKNLYLLR